MELHDAAVEYLGDVQVPLLVDGEIVRAVELPGLPSPSAPTVEVMAIQIVLKDAIGPPVARPDVPVGRDVVVIGRRVRAGRKHRQKLAVFVEDLKAAVA